MPSTRELRRRIKSVKSTRQITKAMELVASAKMRKASEATIASRPYALRAFEVLQDVTNQPLEELSHPLITDREIKREVVFLVSSDRGLAGSYNTNILKQALTFLQAEEAMGREVHFITMGKKVEQSLVKMGATVIQSYPHSATHPASRDVFPLSNHLTEQFLKGEYDRVMILFTEFFSMLRQDTIFRQLLPLQPARIAEEIVGDVAFTPKSDAHQFMYEPSPEDVLGYVLPRLVDVQIYQALQESLASEHSSRRMAMKSATDNASDMIDDLTLTYNSVRQGTITREIAEITSGAAAL